MLVLSKQHCQAFLGKGLKTYRGVLRIFEKALEMDNCPKIIVEVIVIKKNPILATVRDGEF